MEIEELKSTTFEEPYVNLKYVMPERERKQYAPATFDSKNIVPYEFFNVLFNQNCAIIKKSDTCHVALGFLASIPTRATIVNNTVIIENIYEDIKAYDWTDKIFDNLYGFKKGEIHTETTIYETASNYLVCVDIDDPYCIELTYFDYENA
jgi:hypothetical protein